MKKLINIPDLPLERWTPDPGHPCHADNPVRLTNWYPLVSAVAKTPETRFIYGIETMHVIDALDGNDAGKGAVRKAAKQVRHAVREWGGECFMRSDVTSAKHSWKDSCHVATDDLPTIEFQIMTLLEDAEMMGAPWSLALVVRRMLPTKPAFLAFHGRMPVTKERRYFVRDGVVLCHHPYWPPKSIRDPSVPYWRKSLAKINRESAAEVAELSAASVAVSRVVPGAWSVDWLHSRDGWYLIDMAPMATSFHWAGCPNGDE